MTNPTFQLTAGLTERAGASALPYLSFLQAVSQNLDMSYRAENWDTEADWEETLNLLPVVNTSRFPKGNASAFLRMQHSFVFLSFDAGQMRASVLSDQDPSLVFDQIRRVFPPRLAPTEPEVRMTFWWHSNTGPQSSRRTIAVHRWSDLVCNYPGQTRLELSDLVEHFHPQEHAGQLLLLHGPPGTGKTNALRALSWEWREWSDFHYIADPEEFFGSASYLLDVMLQEEQGFHNSDGPRWRTMILEDSGELLGADAKERLGQGLSRLLNAVDGLIGQGLRTLLIVTTNEELGHLHPAVTRPGRCASKIGFVAFTAAEASRWLERPVDGPRTLAQLFAEREGRRTENGQLPLGFAKPAALAVN